MSTTVLRRLSGAFALVALIGACSDHPVAPTTPAMRANAPALAVTGGPDLSDWRSFQGEVWLCKDGNGVGNFTFDWTVELRRDGSPVASGTTIVPAGGCVMAVHLDTVHTLPVHVTVTEQVPPANWAFTAITHAYGAGLPVTPDTPVIDLATRTIRDVHASNDLGVQITFFNTYTPPAPACTYTQGFWKTHQELWDESGEMVLWNGALFFNSGVTHAELFAMSVAGGNSYVKLAHQYMAARLNVNLGGDPAIDAALAQAAAYFAAHPAGSTYIKSAAWNALATVLDDYNNGITGPGHCPD